MIKTSETYNPFPVIRRVGFEVEFRIIDVNAAKTVTASSESTAVVSSPAQTLDEERRTQDYQTLELNHIILDGSQPILPDDVTGLQFGWWSEALSDADGVFSAPPSIRYDFTTDISSIGFTAFYAVPPTRLRITAYDADGATIASQEFTPEGDAHIYEMPVQNYRAVVFEFLETALPYRRIRMLEVVFGITRVFDETSLANVSLSYAASLTAESVAMRQLVFKFDNSDHEFNLLNPEGLYAYLQDGQQVVARGSIGGEFVNMGSFRYAKATSKDSALTAEITANDIIYSLDRSEFLGGSAETTTLADAIGRVLDGFGVDVDFAGDAGSRRVRMAVPESAKRREAVRMLAQAAMCSVWTKRDGALLFHPLAVADEPDGRLTASELYNYDGISVGSRTDCVELSTMSEFDEVEKVYIAGSGDKVVSVRNPCVADENGQAVAEWLLAQYNRLKSYNVQNRCDLATEIGDTLNVADAYGQNANATVIGIEIRYNGGLSATTRLTSA